MVSSLSLALVCHHRTIPHLSFVGDFKAPCTAHQTNMSVEEVSDDCDYQLDGNNDDVRVDSVEDFVYQSLNISKEAGDADVFNQPGNMNESGAMNEPEESGLLSPLTSIWNCPLITKCTGVAKDGHSYAGWKCGFCPRNHDGSEASIFCPRNATKVLYHVARISGYDIRPCRGFIPPGNARQYQMLYQLKAAEKDQQKQNRDVISSNINNLQDRALHSLLDTSRLGGHGAL
jgi:hypothetical protein